MFKKQNLSNIVRYFFIVALAYLSFVILDEREPYILHSINLIFHEAGHTICMFFGEFIYFLGGTLGQLAIPAVCGISFWKQRNLFATAIMSWWFGQNLIDISIYISDARTQILPLLGGEHDWTYLLGRLNLLQYDIFIGDIVRALGILIMFGALVGACVVIKQHKHEQKFNNPIL